MTTLHEEPRLEAARRQPASQRSVGAGDRFGAWMSSRRLGPSAAVLGGAATIVTWLGSWNPSYWGDEAATVLSASRPIGTLLAELRHVDAVHGLYYLLMHFWIGVFGASELSTRAPSAVAVGFLVSGTVVLGARLAGLRFGILTGVVCAILPRTTFLATEARSYAMGTAVAVWLTVLFVGLWRRRERRLRPWLVYGVLAGLASYLFLYLILLVVVHGAVLASSSRGRELLGRWLRAAGAAAVVALPFALLAVSERHQVAFLAVRGYATPGNVLVEQWFGNPPTQGSWLVPILAWALILLAVGVVAVRTVRARPDAVLENRSSDRDTVRLGVAWLVIPTALLLAGNEWLSPMYNVRYLSFSTPAAALLIATGVVAVARLLTPTIRRLGIRMRRTALPRRASTAGVMLVLLLVLGGAALPGYLAQRGPYAKDGGSDWRQVADYVAAHAVTGDAVIFDPTTKPSRRPELASRLYPAQFAAVDAVALVKPYYDRAALWDVMAPLARVRPELAEAHAVWALELPQRGTEPQDITDLTDHGYRVISAHRIHRTVVYELQREGA